MSIKIQGLFITGTGTSVGKTTIGALLAYYFSTKYQVKVRKPIASGCDVVNGKYIAKDAIELSKNIANEPLDLVCKYRFSEQLSPEQASIINNKKINLNDLVVACKNNISDDDFIIVEGAGGIYSPIAQNTLNIDLILALKLPIVIVIKDELGCVNQALLTIQVAKNNNLDIFAIVLNSFTTNSFNNKNAIYKYSKIPIINYYNNTNNFISQLKNL